MDVGEWLRRLGLGQYEANFRDNAIDETVLPRLNAEDLKELGVAAVGHRRRLLDAIAALASEAPQASGAGAGAREGAERRQLTVMFCDLVGSTALANRLDPEDLRTVIGAYHRACAETVARFHGFVAQFLGDGVLVYFGYPEAREDDAEQAVRSALALAASVPALDPQGAGALAPRIGIATGVVVIGDLAGSGAGAEHKIVGETPNLAARLQALAPAGAIVIADATRRLVGGLFECEDLGAVELKGFAEPVQAWLVRGESRVESRFEALRSGASLLVGREEEAALLFRRWEQVKEGAGRVVLLAGEAGIGKSRLARALRDRLAGEKHRRLSWFCSPHHQESALFPVIAQLERAAGFERDDAAAAKLDKLAALLRRSGITAAEPASLLAELLSLPSDGRYPPLNLTPPRRKARTLQALLALLEGLAATEPVLAVFEDVHWLDPTSRELMDLLVERVASLRVLLVVTFRPDFAPPWTGRSHVTLLALNRLGRREGGAVVAAVAGAKTLPREVAEQIIARADGVPLFIEELTKTVIESGLLSEEGDHYALIGELPPLAIPTTLQSSLMARLDRLAPAREVAQIGAAIGRQFSYELVNAVARMPEDRLGDALKLLVAAELVFVRGAPPDAEYTFKHALVQDAAYATLLRERRHELHARIAAALEREEAVEPELLAHHLAEAGEIERAMPHWLAAGHRAAQRSANAEAVAHFKRGIAAAQSLPDTPDRARRELELQLALGPTLLGLWKGAEAKAAFARAHEICEALGERRGEFRAVWGRWLSDGMTGWDADSQSRLVDDLFVIARSLDDDGLRLQAHHAAWPTRLQMGDIKTAWEHVQSGLALYDPEKHADHATTYAGHDPGVCGMGFGSACLWLLGFPDQSARMFAEAQSLAERLGHLPTFVTVLPMWAPVRVYALRDAGQAARDAERITALGNDLEIEWATAVGTMLGGWALAQQGHAEGIGQLHHVLDGWKSDANRAAGRLLFDVMLADSHLRHGEIEAGLRTLAHAAEARSGILDAVLQAEVFRTEGELRQAAGAREAAERLFRQALAVATQQQAKSLELRAATSLARLLREERRRNEARDALSPVYRWFTEGFATPDLTDAAALLNDL